MGKIDIFTLSSLFNLTSREKNFRPVQVSFHLGMIFPVQGENGKSSQSGTG
jgi:hypothetical protein